MSAEPRFDDAERECIMARQLDQCELNGCMRPFWLQDGKFELEYRVALSAGGAHHPDNMRAICMPCYDWKHSDDYVDDDDDGSVYESVLGGAMKRAAESGNVVEVAALLAERANPDVGLIHAAANGQTAVVDLLISNGGKLLTDGLILASFGGHEAVIERILATGAVNVYHKNYALAYACRGGYKSVVERLVWNGANHWNVALRYACHDGQERTAELMIANGATDCRAGLEYACFGGNLRVIQAMIEVAADRGRLPESWPEYHPEDQPDLLFDLVTSTDVRRSALAGIPEIQDVYRRVAAGLAVLRETLRDLPPELRSIVADYCCCGA